MEQDVKQAVRAAKEKVIELFAEEGIRERLTLLTVDLDLYLHAKARGLDAINFNELISAADGPSSVRARGIRPNSRQVRCILGD